MNWTTQARVGFMFWYASSGLVSWFQGRFTPDIRQETQDQRNVKISRIEIFPGDVTVELGEQVRFAAVGYDAEGNPVGGARFKWRARSTTGKGHIRVTPKGELEATTAGTFTLEAQNANKTAQVTVVVRPGVKRDPKEKPTSVREISSRDLPPEAIGATKGKPRDNRSRQTGTEKSSKTLIAKKNAHAPRPAMLPDIGWDPSNYWSADDPGNNIGNPPGSPADGGAGSGNFQVGAPVVSLSGRRINITLGLAYNSRLWNKAGNNVNYDNDRGWPAPGFNLGLGKMFGIGVYTGAMLIDADGTRHSYSGSVNVYNWGTNGFMHTTDGSFIDYTYTTGTNGIMLYGQARLPNGTVINYGATGPGGLYATSIEDANGNFVTITYVNNSGPRIQTITDTLNRTINFHYNYNNLLTAVTAPGYNGGAARTLIRLHYHQHALSGSNYGFSSSVTASVRDANPWVLDAIYYPATGTGFWFNDSDSYSSYGMLAKVVEQRGMGFSASSLNDMGTVSPGYITRRETYNYPLTPNYTLIDAPTYSTMTEEWTRDGTNFDSATTSYAINQNSNPRSTIVTYPNGTKSKQLSIYNPGQYNDGLTYYDETYVVAGQPLQSSTTYWQPGAYNTARPYRIEWTDEHQQMTATDIFYGSVYNQVTEMKDYDYGGTALRRSTRTTYQNSSIYTNR
ncbi:MAG TPA: hypothetical protein VFS77_18570, partial [Pyrinomonadaceae bacterium]|nr:hypothetical protein [Pyrinomonadaceae bacterium]